MIKGLCVEQGGNGARFIFDGSTPLVGRNYFLEDLKLGSNKQNKLFHALRTVFFNYMFETNTFRIEDNSIIYDLRCNTVEGFKELLKAEHGQGRTFKFSDKNHKLVGVDNFEDIPDYVIEDFNNGNRDRINQKIYPWHKYTMPQRHKLIKRVFLLMDIFGVDSGKYSDIKKGLEDIEADRLEQLKRDREKKNDENN